ncbi:MAG: hypothetical protein SFX74_00180 [Fimbriimonadaceae bacterium]|nr:hypothetical protein [Fimbriimonadaceae bacterium]
MFHLVTLSATVAIATAPVPASESVGSLRFIENKGQWDSAAQFLLQFPGQNVWVTRSGLALDFNRIESARLAPLANAEPTTRRKIGHVVKVDFVGASRSVQPVGVGAGNALRNWVLPGKTVTGVREFSEARLVNVVPGVTARYYVDGGAPRYDAILAPGTNPNSVVLNYQGANNLRIGADGSLMYDTVLGTVKEQRLFVYQDVNGVRKPVDAAFRLVGKNQVGFTLGQFDRTEPVTIDPQILAAWTYVGGSSENFPTSISQHPSGDYVISGRTAGSGYPTTVGAYDTTFGSTNDYFISRFRRTLSGAALRFSTFIGTDNGNEQSTSPVGFGAVNKCYPNGDIVFAGTTSGDGLFTSAGAIQPGRQSNNDVYLIRLNGALGTPRFGSYFGGGQAETLFGLDINPLNGDVAISIQTGSRNLGTGTEGAFGPQNYAVGGSANPVKPVNTNATDMFVAVLGSQFQSVKMGTYYGGEGVDRPTAIAYGRGYESLVLAGSSASDDLPITVGGMASGTNRGAFVTRFRIGNDLASGGLMSAIGFGRTAANTDVFGLHVDQVTDRVTVGGVAAGDFNTTDFATIAAGAPGYSQSYGTAATRAFVARLRPELQNISGWTFVGDSASGISEISAVDVATNGTIHVGGFNSSGTFGIVSPGGTNLSNNQASGNNQAMIARISNGFQLIGTSLVGDDTSDDRILAGFLEDALYGNFIVVGRTVAGINPPTISGFTPYQASPGGNIDAFIGRFAFYTDPVSIIASRAVVGNDTPISFRVFLNAPVTNPAGQVVTFTKDTVDDLRFPGGASSISVTIPQGADTASIQALTPNTFSGSGSATVNATSSGSTVSVTVTLDSGS